MGLVQVRLLHHLIRPIRGGAAGVLIVFSPLLAIAAHAGLLGIPLAFILTSWFFKYAYILFDHTVWGFDEPPALDIHMLNPVDEQRPLAQVVILGLIYAAVKLAETRLGSAVAVSLAAAAALLLPASVAVLGVERNILKALSPMALARIIPGLGIMYPAVLGLIACGLLGAVLLERLELWLPLQLGIAMFAILSMFSVLGGALYERRNELGLDSGAARNSSRSVRGGRTCGRTRRWSPTRMARCGRVRTPRPGKNYGAGSPRAAILRRTIAGCAIA